MAGLGAAIGGFAQGFGQGMKIRSDLEDAKAKREFMGLQKEKLQQELDVGKQFAELQQGMATETQDYAKGTGNYAPAEGQTYDPTNPAVVDQYYTRIGAMAKQQAILANKNPLEVDEQMNKFRKERFSERVMQASSLLKSGDESGFELLKPVYNQMFKDGRELVRGAYNKDNDSFDLTYKDKDGTERQTSVGRAAFAENIVPLALNPADAAKFAMQNKELALKEREVQGMENWRKVQEGLSREELGIKREGLSIERMKTGGLLKYYENMGKAALDRAGADRTAADLARTTSALNNQLTQVTTLLGIDKNFDPAKRAPEDIEAHNQKLSLANSAMWLVSQGVQDGGKLKLDATQAIQMAQAADNASFRDIKRAGPGMFYTEINGTRVPVNIKESEYKQLEAAFKKQQQQDAPGPTASDARRGIKPPGTGFGQTGFGIVN